MAFKNVILEVTLCATVVLLILTQCDVI